MWAQLISARVGADRDTELRGLMEQLKEIEQPDSGWIRSTMMRDQSDPEKVLLLVVFESEEKARARESDPRREAGLEGVRATMASLFEGDREFTDLDVVLETTM